MEPTPSSPASPAKSRWLPGSPGLLACLAVLVLAAFWPSLGNDFVRHDDQTYVTSNLHVQAGLTWAGVTWAFTTFEGANWHPVTWLSHMLDCQLFGLRPWGHHLSALLIHTTDCLLLFAVLYQFTRARGRSFLVAALWGVHPLRTESVAWVAERKDVLSTLFFLLTLWAYGRFAAASQPPKSRPASKPRPASPASLIGHSGSRGYYVLALFLFALGLMSKPMLVTVPFLLLLLDYWPLGRFPGHGWLSLVAEKWPFFLLSTLDCAITMQAQQMAMEATSPASLLSRFQNAPVSCCRYLLKTVWPSGLSYFYPRPASWPWATVVVAAVVVVLISAGAWAGWRRRPHLAVGWLWFLGTLVPVLGLVQVGGQAIADRYTYLPAIGLGLLVVWEAADWVARRPVFRLPLELGAVVLLAACLPLTWCQVSYWRNSETLARHALRLSDQNYAAHLLLGVAFSEAGRLDDAIREAEVVLRLKPVGTLAHLHLGNYLLRQGRLDEAVAHFECAVQATPRDPEAHLGLGTVLYRQGHVPEAIAQYQAALELKPDFAEALNNLGGALNKAGRVDEAIAAYDRALAAKPDYALAHYNLGCALGGRRRFREAIEHLREATRLRPDLAAAHNDLAAALLSLGSLPEAATEFAKAVAADPANPDYHCNLGVALSSTDLPAAINQFQEALRLKPGDPDTTRLLEAARAHAPGR